MDRYSLLIALLIIGIHPACLAETGRELLDRASQAADAGDSERAVRLASAALLQGPKLSSAYYLRGREQFRLGRVAESVADLDAYVQARPEVESRMWERGISYYYAKQFRDGAKQFELYQTYHDNDVENSVWRFLCVARAEGLRQARETMLPIRNDRRVPMMQIYEMFKGQLSPDDVMRAANAGSPDADSLNRQRFYAHLYIGLFHEAHGQPALARRHIMLAEKHKIGHYMWDVAHVHAEQLRKHDKTNTPAP